MDPDEHTVDEVKEYVEEHPDEAQDVLDAEREGKNRSTLVTWLEDRLQAEEGSSEEPQPESPQPEPPQQQPGEFRSP
jgi:hypothetical protein